MEGGEVVDEIKVRSTIVMQLICVFELIYQTVEEYKNVYAKVELMTKEIARIEQLIKETSYCCFFKDYYFRSVIDTVVQLGENHKYYRIANSIMVERDQLSALSGLHTEKV